MYSATVTAKIAVGWPIVIERMKGLDDRDDKKERARQRDRTGGQG